MDTLLQIISYVYPTDWTLAGLTSFFGLGILRGLLLFTVVSKAPEWIQKSSLPLPTKFILTGVYSLVALVALTYDCLINVMLMTLLFIDTPHGWHSFSWRLGYYINKDTGIRHKVAVKICRILSKIDPDHCNKVYKSGK